MRTFCLSELCKKEIICAVDGKKLGYPQDIVIDCKCGQIQSIVVPCKSMFSLLGGKNCIRIPWCDVERIGADVIWVCGCYDERYDKKRDCDCC